MKKFIKSFFYSDNKVQPVYFWITILMILIIITFTGRILDYFDISDTLFLGLLGFVAAWIGLYNLNSKNKGMK